VVSANHDDEAARLAQIRARLQHVLEAEQVRRWGRAAEAQGTPSRWAPVPLLELIREDNPTIVQKAPGKHVTGHQPLHGSRSGQCLVVWTAEGRFWCSSCGKRGDAVTWVMQTRGLTFPEATTELIARYGAPKGWRQRTTRSARALVIGGGS
jgi:hypothetical protein